MTVFAEPEKNYVMFQKNEIAGVDDSDRFLAFISINVGPCGGALFASSLGQPWLYIYLIHLKILYFIISN